MYDNRFLVGLHSQKRQTYKGMNLALETNQNQITIKIKKLFPNITYHCLTPSQQKDHALEKTLSLTRRSPSSKNHLHVSTEN